MHQRLYEIHTLPSMGSADRRWNIRRVPKTWQITDPINKSNFGEAKKTVTTRISGGLLAWYWISSFLTGGYSDKDWRPHIHFPLKELPVSVHAFSMASLWLNICFRDSFILAPLLQQLMCIPENRCHILWPMQKVWHWLTGNEKLFLSVHLLTQMTKKSW